MSEVCTTHTCIQEIASPAKPPEDSSFPQLSWCLGKLSRTVEVAAGSA
jgi:hypothetical protein